MEKHLFKTYGDANVGQRWFETLFFQPASENTLENLASDEWHYNFYAYEYCLIRQMLHRLTDKIEVYNFITYASYIIVFFIKKQASLFEA